MKTQTTILPESEETQQVMQRYDLAHAHNLVYTYDGLTSLGIHPEFILALLQVQEDANAFKKENFDRFRLEVLVDYIRKTHQYYLNKKLLEVEQSIHLLLNSYPVAHPLLLLLNTFYKDYRNHLAKHIEMEEKQLLPYILQLEKLAEGNEKKMTTPQQFTLQQFLDQHHDTEKDLQEVRKTILHYSPPSGNQTPYRILLSQLQVFEKDLAVHALIEDEVLLPRAIELEKKLLA